MIGILDLLTLWPPFGAAPVIAPTAPYVFDQPHRAQDGIDAITSFLIGLDEFDTVYEFKGRGEPEMPSSVRFAAIIQTGFTPPQQSRDGSNRRHTKTVPYMLRLYAFTGRDGEFAMRTIDRIAAKCHNGLTGDPPLADWWNENLCMFRFETDIYNDAGVWRRDITGQFGWSYDRSTGMRETV